MAYGKVKWFNDTKGFGMIETKDGKTIFVHYSSIVTREHRTLHEGEEVQFDIYESQKGFRALNVMKVA